MAITLYDNIKIGTGKPSEPKYLNTSNQPYTGTSQVFAQIPIGERHAGLTVLVAGVPNVEYWFEHGTANVNLVQKSVELTVTSTDGGNFSAIAQGGNSYINPADLAATEIVTIGADVANTIANLNFCGESAKFGISTYDQTGNNVIYIEAKPDLTDEGTLQIVDNRVGKVGLTYFEDYSPYFVDESLISRRYASQNIGGYPSNIYLTYPSNGDFIQWDGSNNAWKNGTLVGADGIVFDSNTNEIKLSPDGVVNNVALFANYDNTHNRSIVLGYRYGVFGSTNVPLFTLTSSDSGGAGASLVLGNTELNNFIRLSGNSINVTTPTGIKYNANYATEFSKHSLIDKNYVTGLTSTLVNSLISFNRRTTNYTLVLGDAGKLVETNTSTGNTVTIPPNSSVAFSIGTQINFTQYGAGQTTIVAGSGVTIRSASNKTKLNVQYSFATAIKVGTNEWYLTGDLTS